MKTILLPVLFSIVTASAASAAGEHHLLKEIPAGGQRRGKMAADSFKVLVFGPE